MTLNKRSLLSLLLLDPFNFFSNFRLSDPDICVKPIQVDIAINAIYVLEKGYNYNLIVYFNYRYFNYRYQYTAGWTEQRTSLTIRLLSYLNIKPHIRIHDRI